MRFDAISFSGYREAFRKSFGHLNCFPFVSFLFQGPQSWIGKAGCIIHVQAEHPEIDSDILDSLPPRHSQHSAAE